MSKVSGDLTRIDLAGSRPGQENGMTVIASRQGRSWDEPAPIDESLHTALNSERLVPLRSVGHLPERTMLALGSSGDSSHDFPLATFTPPNLPHLAGMGALLDDLSLRHARIPVFALRRNPELRTPGLYANRGTVVYRVVKRTVDVVFALLFGIVALPLILMCCVAIALESPGSPLFVQDRIGRHNQTFRLYKLRTMYAWSVPTGPFATTIPDDPRVTRIGRLLRKMRFDELPQLWNVLRGDMSLIGPRPEMPESAQYLASQIPGFELRTLVRPGLSGWAQVSSGYADSLPKHERRVEYDLYYIRYPSLALDIRVAMQTLRIVLLSRGH